MNAETHSQLANFIWSICNLLRGPYKRNEYRKVILPLTVLRRFDCLLAPTKTEVLKEHAAIKTKPENVVRSLLEKITHRPFYNLSRMDFTKLLDDPNQLAPNLNGYINGFSKNVRDIMERFAFDQQIARMAEKNLLYEVIKAFSRIDLSSTHVDNEQMGYVFEELIRIGAEQANEEAGEHFTPREVIRLMVNLLLSPEKDLRRSHVVKTIYDPACGTGGMLSGAEAYTYVLNHIYKGLVMFLKSIPVLRLKRRNMRTHQPPQRLRPAHYRVASKKEIGIRRTTRRRSAAQLCGIRAALMAGRGGE